jgi:enamine deaminase RidA (YjgF/YER057c/UK114 family)
VTRIVGSGGFLPAPAGPYSQAVRIGSVAHTAGQVGIDPATGAIAGSAARTTVYVGLPPGLLVEIDAIVALP